MPGAMVYLSVDDPIMDGKKLTIDNFSVIAELKDLKVAKALWVQK